MTRRMWTQQDAPQLLRDRLRDAIPGSGELIRAELPAGWTPRDGPVCTVVGDGPQSSARGTDRELVRVTVRSDELPWAREVMTEIDAYLTTPGLNILGFSISRTGGSGLISGPDPLVGGCFASATYSVGTTRKVHEL